MVNDPVKVVAAAFNTAAAAGGTAFDTAAVAAAAAAEDEGKRENINSPSSFSSDDSCASKEHIGRDKVNPEITSGVGSFRDHGIEEDETRGVGAKGVFVGRKRRLFKRRWGRLERLRCYMVEL